MTRLHLPGLTAWIVLGLTVVGCGASATVAPTGNTTAPLTVAATAAPTAAAATATTEPVGSPPSTRPPSDAPVPRTPAPSGGPGTRTVPWGTIWTDVPPSYPAPDKGTRDPADTSASAVWTRGGRRQVVVDDVRSRLEAAGWSLGAVATGEHDSTLIEASKGPPDCRTRVTVEVFDTGIRISALVAAACPWE